MHPSLQNNFNFVAPFYDHLASLIFGKAIKNSQRWLLQFIPNGSSILIIGGGTGWILEELLPQVNNCNILYLEASEKMLERSRKRYEKSAKKSSNQVEFRLGTEASLQPSENFDFIFTGFLLDLFQPEPLYQLMQQLHQHLKPNGTWLLADFHPQNATLFWQKSLLKLMIVFFKISANLQANQLPDLEQAFRSFPLHLQAEEFFYHHLIRSAVYKKV